MKTPGMSFGDGLCLSSIAKPPRRPRTPTKNKQWPRNREKNEQKIGFWTDFPPDTILCLFWPFLFLGVWGVLGGRRIHQSSTASLAPELWQSRYHPFSNPWRPLQNATPTKEDERTPTPINLPPMRSQREVRKK
eukprot:1071740-Amphidinium_carterae.1